MYSDLSGIDFYASRIVLDNGARLIPPHDSVLRAAEVLAGLSAAYAPERWVFDKDPLKPIELLGVQLLDGDLDPMPLEVVEQLLVTFAVDPDLVPDRQVATYLSRLTQFSDTMRHDTHRALWEAPTSVGRRLLRRLRESGDLGVLVRLLYVDERLEPKSGWAGTHDDRQFLLARAVAVDLDAADWARQQDLFALLLSDRSPLNDHWQDILRSGRPRERPHSYFF